MLPGGEGWSPRALPGIIDAMKQFTLALATSLVACATLRAQHGEPPVRAPFDGLDTLCVNEWWERPASRIVDLRVPRDQVVAFGIYTVQPSAADSAGQESTNEAETSGATSRADAESGARAESTTGILKLSAQLFPLYPEETREVRLEILPVATEGQAGANQEGDADVGAENAAGDWREIARATVNDLGWSATFRIEPWDMTRDVRYRIRHGERAQFEGLIRKDPIDRDRVSIAALSCNSNQDRGMRPGYVQNLRHQDPDLVFFAGDQSYDHKQHTAAWLKFGLQFRDVFRDRPCITIPDDHDIGQGNVWGESGKVARLAGGADGGYFHHAEYVKMVDRCQTAHLPDPFDPAPIGQGIGVYYTSLRVGGIDFAILEDRKFKSGPAGKIPPQGPRPDHIQNPDYDPASIDLPGLELLGERQLRFLDVWGRQWDGVAMKAVLSQTGFCGGAHIHGKKENRLHADLDSNGWPQRGRDEALRRIAAARAIHIGGDQHLATLIHHGIDEFRDGPWAFIVPAIVNNYYSRWWWPEDEQPGGDRDPASPLPWTGDYLDGFGNRITMEAYANPESPSHGGGWGRVIFDKKAGTITFECWPRDADVTQPGAQQFTGWPRTIAAPRR